MARKEDRERFRVSPGHGGRSLSCPADTAESFRIPYRSLDALPAPRVLCTRFFLYRSFSYSLFALTIQCGARAFRFLRLTANIGKDSPIHIKNMAVYKI